MFNNIRYFAGPLEFGPADYLVVFILYVLPVAIVMVLLALGISKFVHRNEPKQEISTHHDHFKKKYGHLAPSEIVNKRRKIVLFLSSIILLAFILLAYPIQGLSQLFLLASLLAVLLLIIGFPSIISRERVLYEKNWHYLIIYLIRFLYWPILIGLYAMVGAYFENDGYYPGEKDSIRTVSLVLMVLFALNVSLNYYLQKKYRASS